MIVAEQVAAALRGEFVSHAVNIPQVPAEEMDLLGPFLPLAAQLGRLATGLCEHGLDRIDVTYDGALAEHDTRLVTSAVLMGAFAARSDEPVNLVNARAVAESRGIAVGEEHVRSPGDYTSLVRVAAATARPSRARRSAARTGRGWSRWRATRSRSSSRAHGRDAERRPPGGDRPRRDDVRRGGRRTSPT